MGHRALDFNCCLIGNSTTKCKGLAHQGHLHLSASNPGTPTTSFGTNHLSRLVWFAPRAANSRNLAWMEARGLIREVTGQGRYRMWRTRA